VDYRHPNPPGSTPDPQRTEAELLIAEMVSSSAWREMLEHVIAPRVRDIRAKLLQEVTLSEVERYALVTVLREYANHLGAVYAMTEGEHRPEWVENFFR